MGTVEGCHGAYGADKPSAALKWHSERDTRPISIIRFLLHNAQFGITCGLVAHAGLVSPVKH